MGFERVIAKKITDKGVTLTPKHNSIFTAIDEHGMDSNIVHSAIEGMANLVTGDINRFRNVILPEAKEYESAVIEMTKQAPNSPADNVTIHTVEHHQGLELFPETLIPDAHVVATYQDLPDKPLLIEWDKTTVDDNIKSSNVELNDHIKELLLSYDDEHLKSLHNQVFGSLSKNNPTVVNLGTDIVGNYDNLVLLLVMTVGYVTGTLGVSNLQANEARIPYLYKFRNILVTLLSQYEKTYATYINNDVLVVDVTIGAKDSRSVTLVGETYKKYLEDHSVDAIIGLGLSNDPVRRLSYTRMVADIDKYTSVYDASIKVASVRAASDKLRVLRIAYVASIRKQLNDATEAQLEVMNIPRDNIPDVANLVSDRVKLLSDEELMDTTSITREIIGEVVYADPLFTPFVEYMEYYSKMFPKFSVDELVTASTVGIIIDRLEAHLDIEKMAGVDV
jgi:hypothetical protein